jgi:hypothetical protein
MAKKTQAIIKLDIQHHDWDRTLISAKALTELGIATGDAELSFASLTGGMVLTVAALESFLNSMGYGEALSISWDSYQLLPLVDKLKLMGSRLGFKINMGRAPYDTIAEAVRWRNDLLHSKPQTAYGISIDDSANTGESTKGVGKALDRKYEFRVTPENAKRFHTEIRSVMAEFQTAYQSRKKAER